MEWREERRGSAKDGGWTSNWTNALPSAPMKQRLAPSPFTPFRFPVWLRHLLYARQGAPIKVYEPLSTARNSVLPSDDLWQGSYIVRFERRTRRRSHLVAKLHVKLPSMATNNLLPVPCHDLFRTLARIRLTRRPRRSLASVRVNWRVAWKCDTISVLNLISKKEVRRKQQDRVSFPFPSGQNPRSFWLDTP